MNTKLLAQSSRLKMEPIALIGLDYCRINPTTLYTTPPGFIYTTSFGKTYIHGSGWTTPPRLRDRFYEWMFVWGSLISYEYTPRLDIQFGLIATQAGGQASMFFGGFGVWARVLNFPLMLNYQCIEMPKIKSSVNLITGIAINIPLDGWSPQSRMGFMDSINTITFEQKEHFINSMGFCVQAGLQFKHKLNNGRALNFKLLGALGLVPIYSVDFITTINTQRYYTEVISNGSYISLGIGYEFNILKKYFGYTKVEKQQGTKNGYFYH